MCRLCACTHSFVQYSIILERYGLKFWLKHGHIDVTAPYWRFAVIVCGKFILLHGSYILRSGLGYTFSLFSLQFSYKSLSFSVFQSAVSFLSKHFLFRSVLWLPWFSLFLFSPLAQYFFSLFILLFLRSLFVHFFLIHSLLSIRLSLCIATIFPFQRLSL
jgi:hypothetical protein